MARDANDEILCLTCAHGNCVWKLQPWEADGTSDILPAVHQVLIDWNHQKITFFSEPPALHTAHISPSTIPGSGGQVCRVQRQQAMPRSLLCPNNSDPHYPSVSFALDTTNQPVGRRFPRRHSVPCHVVCDNSNRFWELVPGCVYSCCPRGIKRCVAMSGLVLDGSAAQQLRSIPFEHQWEPDIETLYQVQSYLQRLTEMLKYKSTHTIFHALRGNRERGWVVSGSLDHTIKLWGLPYFSVDPQGHIIVSGGPELVVPM
ncbi:hypothetical protein DFH94DRAFT_680484 [Russula ochroleuca]|uniref:Uncharacterized protein n=1 Tax=Russula ochroleuca TaxID=152965 RepID=A0A9P5TAH8_9AGAM|nr:hypothetical protein DFH94DRAFT_680484 [Russula ochroleuca]